MPCCKIKGLLKENVIFDGRNLYDLTNMRDNEFYYESIGRKTVLGHYTKEVE